MITPDQIAELKRLEAAARGKGYWTPEADSFVGGLYRNAAELIEAAEWQAHFHECVLELNKDVARLKIENDGLMQKLAAAEKENELHVREIAQLHDKFTAAAKENEELRKAVSKATPEMWTPSASDQEERG